MAMKNPDSTEKNVYKKHTPVATWPVENNIKQKETGFNVIGILNPVESMYAI